MVTKPLFDAFRDYVVQEKLFRPGAKIVAAISGGPDSVTMLHLLCELKHTLGLKVIVAHYNHGLRRSAKRDQDFVRDMASKLRVTFVTDTNRKGVPVKGSVEEFAREKRYAFLRKVVRSKKADCLAVAHTRDDLAETTLMRILRGAGLSGLRGMMPKRIWQNICVVRPLLFMSRAQVVKYVSIQGLKTVTDPTNRSLDHFRNRVRLKVLPGLEREAFGDVRARLAGLASVAAIDYDYIEGEAKGIYQAVALHEDKSVLLPLAKLSGLHPALRRCLLRIAVEKLKGNLNALDQGHIALIEQMVLEGKKEAAQDLPDGVRATMCRPHLKLALE